MAEEHEIQVDLPRARIGGLQRGPVEDLLKRMSDERDRLESENKELRALVDAAAASSASEPKRPEAPASPVAQDQTPWFVGPADPLPADSREAIEPGPSTAPVAEVESELPQDAGELATAVIELAHRAAQDLRESTRQDCEVMIKKARDRADKLERDLERSRAKTTSELEELQVLQREMRENMRASLQAVLRTFVAERSAERPILEWSELPGLFAATEQVGKKSNRKKSKP